MNGSRRDFLRAASIPAAGVSLSAACHHHLPAGEMNVEPSRTPALTIGLSQYSLHRMIQSRELDPLDYPSFVIDTFGIEQIDLYRGAMPAEGDRLPFLQKLRSRSEQAGTNILSMTVEPLRLGSDDASQRCSEIKRFERLVDQASVVGATYLRVFLDAGQGCLDAQAMRAADGLRRLSDYSAKKRITTLVEPGVGSSRNGLWLARVIQEVDHPNCRSMPDFGKFGKFDRYAGTAALLASARMISAKSYALSEDGLELRCDYPKLLGMIVDAGFCGTVAIEYQGEHAEVQGVLATQRLLQRLIATLAT